jgi:DinB superfamily
MSVAAIYEGWQKTQAHLMNRLPKLGPQELALRASPEGWPIWAIVSHLAGARVYWLCGVFKEPGADTTPFSDPFGDGWEDHLDAPRGPEELTFAVESSWRIVESCLARWTPEMLSEVFTRERGSEVQRHTRHSVLTRIVMHDAFHCGEVSSLLGAHGFASMDPWDPIP